MSLKWNSPHSRALPTSTEFPVIMGVLNVSRDSFSDGGKYLLPELALSQCEKMINEGAQIIDIGAESTRPDAKKLSLEDELSLLIPRLKFIRDSFPQIPISVDTYKPEVARRAIELGADIINDVVAFSENGHCPMALLAEELNCPMIATRNSRGENVKELSFDSLKNSTEEFLNTLRNSGLRDSQIILDAGVGFGKTRDVNFEIVARLGELRSFGIPLLLGVSRKSMFAEMVGSNIDLRDVATSAVSAFTFLSRSVDILRVHNVSTNIVAIKTFMEILKWTK